MPDLRERIQSALGSHYTIERELGGGGMSRVFVAEEVRFGRKVVIKVLTHELAQGLSAERFEREIKLAAQLQQANIVPVLGAGEIASGDDADDRTPLPYYTMPFVDGESLRARLATGPIPFGKSVAILRDVARALAYAHSHGVAHRDIKPENVLLSGGAAVVTDFGIAKALSASKTQAPGGTLTVVGTSLGTPAYMAPEQAVGDHVDERADIYSWGVLAYELLAGAHPFAGKTTAQQLIAAHIAEQPRSLKEVDPGMSPLLADLVARCLDKDPGKRPQSASEILQVLEEPALMVSGANPVVSRSGSASSGKRTLRNAGAVVVGLLVIGAAFVGRGRIASLLHASSSAGSDSAAIAADSGELRMAVLPFENLGDSSDAYFADGMTDAVRGKLTAMHNLEVIARASSEEYRDSRKTPRQIASELGVHYLLTATVRWAKQADGSSRVQVSPELVELGDGVARSRWQQAFDAPLTDVFKVQSDIAGQVAQALDVALGSSDRQQLAERPTQDLAAYDDYLKGEAIEGTDNLSLRRAAALYARAVSRDSTFGLGWARLAYTEAFAAGNGMTDVASKAAVDHALAMAQLYAPHAPETYNARAVYYLDLTRDIDVAIAVIQEGVARYPGNPDLIRKLGIAQTAAGQLDKGLANMQRAVAMDPQSLRPLRALGQALIFMHRSSEAVGMSRRAIAIAPGDMTSINNAVMAHVVGGDLPGARAVIADAPATVDRIRLFVFTAMFEDMYWVLTPAQQDSLITAPASAFDADGDQGARALVYAEIYHQRGDLIRTRAWADTASALLGAGSRSNPADEQLPALHGIALALAGHYPDAITSAERGVAMARKLADRTTVAYDQDLLARIYILSGDQQKALDIIEPLLSAYYSLSPGWMAIDPAFIPLKGNPRFERLIKGVAR